MTLEIGSQYGIARLRLQPAATADAVPWTGPVRVMSDRRGTDILGDPFTATYMVLDASKPPIILHHSANSALADAIAAALNTAAAQAADVALLWASLTRTVNAHIETLVERDTLAAENARLRAERDAYRKAKDENDERFMLERDAAIRERDAAMREDGDTIQRLMGERDAALIKRDQHASAIEVWQREAQSAQQSAETIERDALRWAAEQILAHARVSSGMVAPLAVRTLAERIERGPQVSEEGE